MEEFTCLRQTTRGRIIYCPGLKRLVLDYKGGWFIFRLPEFRGFQRHLARLAACPFSRARLSGGDSLHVRDSLSGSAMAIDLADVEELTGLMDAAVRAIDDSTRFPIQEI